jgi:hypothetical protein
MSEMSPERQIHDADAMSGHTRIAPDLKCRRKPGRSKKVAARKCWLRVPAITDLLRCGAIRAILSDLFLRNRSAAGITGVPSF